MLEVGLIEEVKSCLDQGLENWAPLSSVGYKECLQFLKENQNQDWLLEEIIKSTMKLTKKQKTWFQRDKDLTWYDGRNGFQKAREQVEKFFNRT